uniref:Uncharacterized protein n=1 Tax=Cacopsylla melanoneura TaxID=428564 RepID=A0A8D8V0R7_9HEMI
MVQVFVYPVSDGFEQFRILVPQYPHTVAERTKHSRFIIRWYTLNHVSRHFLQQHLVREIQQCSGVEHVCSLFQVQPLRGFSNVERQGSEQWRGALPFSPQGREDLNHLRQLYTRDELSRLIVSRDTENNRQIPE